MTATTIYADPITPVSIQSTDAVYAIARAGNSLSAYGTTGCDVGQNGEGTPGVPFNFNCFESFLSFDTSDISGTITSVVLSLYGTGDGSADDFIVEARLHDWGPTLGDTDWVPGGDLGSKTLLAAKPTNVGWASNYNALTSEAAFAANINRSGSTRMVICSSDHREGNEPPTYFNYIQYWSAAAFGGGGTVNPKLVIETAVGGWGVGEIRMGSN